MAAKPTYEKLEQRVRELEEKSLELKQVEENLSIFKTAVESSINAIGITDLEGKLIYVNDSCVKMWGYNSKDELLGRFLPEFFDGDGVFKTMKELREKGVASGEDVGKRKDGPLFFVQFMASMLNDEARNPSFMFGSFLDITERKLAEKALQKAHDKLEKRVEERTVELIKANEQLEQEIEERKESEEALQKSEALLKKSQAIAHIGSWGLDLVANRLAWSDEVYRIFGLRPQEFDATYEAFLDTVHPDDRAAVDDAYSGSLREGRDNYEIEHRIVRRDSGEIRVVHEKCEHIKDVSDQIVCSVGMVQDITERKRAEEALRDSNEKLNALIRSSPLAIIALDPEGNVTLWNPAAEKMFGWEEKEVMGRFLPFVPEEKMSEHRALRKRVLSGEGFYDVEACRQKKDGSDIYIAISTAPMKDATGRINGIMSVSVDITERKLAEEELEKSYNIINRSPAVAFLWKNEEGWPVEFVSDNVQEVFGYTVEEFKSGKIAYAEIVHPDDLERVSGEVATYSEEKDREEFTHIPYRIVTKDGKEKWLDDRTYMQRDEKGMVTHYQGIVLDITERRSLEAHLQHAQKLESIGILAGGIAHDFNNLLSVIMGNIELAKDDMKPEVGISEFLAGAEKASFQAQELTKQLITFSKGGAPVKKIDSIGELVKETTNFSILGANVKCEFSIPHDLWLVDFDEGQMKHAINNIIVNAVEFMTDSGTIDVKAENFNVTTEQGLPITAGKYIKISIRDQGVGIPAEHLSMVFDPYFSTKEMGIQKGMGLGLTTTYSIINRHDGHITIESERGVGTTFALYLPVYEKDVRELKPVEILKPEKPAIRTGRILVMDDEEMIRNLSRQVLSRLGYEPELVKDGAEAIELYRKAMETGEPFDAVILDLTVKGGMGGKDAVKALLELDPQVKAIVSSGYSNDPVMTNYRAYGFIGALPKPYSKKDLSDMLNQVLGKS